MTRGEMRRIEEMIDAHYWGRLRASEEQRAAQRRIDAAEYRSMIQNEVVQHRAQVQSEAISHTAALQAEVSAQFESSVVAIRQSESTAMARSRFWQSEMDTSLSETRAELATTRYNLTVH